MFINSALLISLQVIYSQKKAKSADKDLCTLLILLSEDKKLGRTQTSNNTDLVKYIIVYPPTQWNIVQPLKIFRKSLKHSFERK